MSIAVLHQVLTQSESRGLARLVLLMLADGANSDGRGFMGSLFLEQRTRLSQEELHEAMYELGKLGELKYELNGEFAITIGESA